MYSDYFLGGRGKVFAFNFNSSCLCSPLLILCDVSVSNLGELWSQKGISICQFLGVEEKTLLASHYHASLTFSQSEAALLLHNLSLRFIAAPLPSLCHH